MALVVCIVPVRKGEAKEAEAQPELEHLGEWINPRAVTGQGPATEPGMTLWDFNQAEVEERHMGRKWDCEFLLMEIPPDSLAAFHFLARFWEVRGSYNDAKDFPAGLEIATSPWTLGILGQLWRTC